MIGTLPVEVVDRIVAALGASLFLDIRYQGGMAIDCSIACMPPSSTTSSQRSASDWEVVVEYTFNQFGERGSVDVLAWHAPTRTLLIVEVKSAFTDLQAMLLSLGRKLRLLPDIVRRDRGWDPVAVESVVVVAGTTSNRGSSPQHRAVFDVSFPARAREIRRWLARPVRADRGVWFVS